MNLLFPLIIVTAFISYGESARATELIFRKTTSTTSTTEETIVEEGQNKTTASNPSETKTEDDDDEDTAGKPKLTGIPQIDYIHDPNLPRELNGYNLSSYPFLDSVPPEDEMDFVCDGLHDGFYASVKFNCQLYHHCLFGVRYDFLCANFTAFDQKTFICHFASEVDCKNSPRYFYRNDALYKASSTTEAPTTTTVFTTPLTTRTTPAPLQPESNKRPNGRPFRRRPPVYDDYYDYYDYEEFERPVRYRRPYMREQVNDYGDYRRPNQRPRKQGGRRKPLYAERRPYAYDDYEEEIEAKPLKKVNKENASILEERKTAVPAPAKETAKPTAEVSPKISSGKKLSIYLQPRPPPKFNGKLGKPTQTSTALPAKQENSRENLKEPVKYKNSDKLENASRNNRYNDQYYDDYVYDEPEQNEEPPVYKTLQRSSPRQEKPKRDNLDYEKPPSRPYVFNRERAPNRQIKYSDSVDN